jgi:hypothetical protein
MSHIITRSELGGRRDYLDDRMITSGAPIDLYIDEVWVSGRYERRKGIAMFVWPDGGMERRLRIAPGMEFRWSPT